MAGEITLSLSNKETRIQWKINHFFIRNDNLIISPNFILFKPKWFLQLHLGSKLTFSDTENDSCNPLRMSVLPLNPTTKYHIEYRMGIQVCNGSEITTEKFESVLNQGFNQTPQRLQLISRKDFESFRNTIVTDNTLSVFCIVRLINVIKPTRYISSPIPSADSDVSSSILLFRDEMKMAGDITLDQSKNETRIEWRITDFSNRKDYWMDSPHFVLFNTKWLLQIWKANESFSFSGTVSDSFLYMKLRPFHLKAGIHIEYVMGIQMSNGSEIRTERFEDRIPLALTDSLEARKIISRKDLESVSDILDSENTLKVFCTLRLLSDYNCPGDITLLGNFAPYIPYIPETVVGDITLNKSESETRIEWTMNHFYVGRKSYNSPNFILFNSNWSLVIIHDKAFIPVFENSNAYKNNLFMCLQRDYCSTDEHHIQYRMGITKSDGSEVITEKFESVFQPRFKKELQEREIISGKVLESIKHTVAHGSTLKVFCTVRLLSDDNPVENVQTSIASAQGVATSSGSSKGVCLNKGIHNLSENFENLYQSKRFTDVTIKVKNKEFLAHKTILSTRSEVFASMFEHDTSEKRSSVVNITDCDPDTFEDFLLYLYTGKLDAVSSSNAASLFKTADKYGVEELKIECVRCMVREITVDSFCDIFHLAVLYGESDLLTTATSFFIRNANAILVTKEWMTLLEEHASLCNELFVKFAKSAIQK